MSVMTKKQRKPRMQFEVKPIDVLATMLDEIAEAIELQRPHFPNDDDDALRARAEAWRSRRYAAGHWSDFAEVAKAEAATDSASPAQTAE
jgi:hypothetical protein